MNFNETGNIAEKIFSTEWVQWTHEGSIPANSNIEKVVNTLLGTISKHCPICLNLNGCCFAKNKCPEIPLHENCHCKIVNIENINPTTTCAIEKFTNYIFNSIKNKGKKQLFELWGYDILDSSYLQTELENQAKIAYLSGEYELGKLNVYGQRISIRINLKNKTNGEDIEFCSGWMVYPNGKLLLTTPYGDK